jgi:uncharacterized protein YrrD
VEVYVDPDGLRVAAVITSKGHVLRRELEGFLSNEVQLWGRDAVLVRDSDILRKGEELNLREGWLAVSDHVKGHDVVNVGGTRIGRMNDVIIDCDGRVVGYSLSEVFTDSPVVVGGRIFVGFTHSLGRDVLIVDETHGGQSGEAAHTGVAGCPPEAGSEDTGE